MPVKNGTPAITPEYQEVSKTLGIKHVHIGVFFDGTNNNMVQQAFFHTYQQTKKNPYAAQAIRTDYNYQEILKLIKERNEKNTKLELALYEQSQNGLYNAVSFSNSKGVNISQLVSEIKELDEIIEKKQAYTRLGLNLMNSDGERGYSNIAILHSLLNNQIDTNDAVYHNLYIEGSGATDITKSNEGNINGLGFGLGLTGVTALVSKAVKYIHLFLEGIKGKLSDNTKYHFYVFGFSRGATCARLFAELTTRDVGKKLDREYEFGQETSKVQNIYDKEKKRLPFMETDFLKTVLINRKYVTVDFLGIYDTVASIGFLKQRDGWTNALSWGYRGFWWNNYNGNFHYMNAHDYGLYSPHNKRVLKTCHICAGDEFRENFALVNLGEKIPQNAMEIIIPGCHSDVGGGYVTENSMDFVLYKFVPRKFEHFLKHNKILEILGYPYLKSKERARLFVNDPMKEEGLTEELNPQTLAKLGWVGNEWRGLDMDTSPEDNKPFTLRVADWTNEIKFKRYAVKGYSNIPLKMMKKCVVECGINWLFQDEIVPYRTPYDLSSLEEEMLKRITVPSGQRMWLIPHGDYSGEYYRKLRLKYLHFTSSCEIWHLRSHVKEENMRKVKEKEKEKESWYKFGEINGANFGNNCNYDNNAKICRIMYNGDEILDGNHTKNVHYLYESGKNGMKLEPIEVKDDIIINHVKQ